MDTLYKLDITPEDHKSLMFLIDTSLKARGLDSLGPVMAFVMKVEAAGKALKDETSPALNAEEKVVKD